MLYTVWLTYGDFRHKLSMLSVRRWMPRSALRGTLGRRSRSSRRKLPRRCHSMCSSCAGMAARDVGGETTGRRSSGLRCVLGERRRQRRREGQHGRGSCAHVRVGLQVAHGVLTADRSAWRRALHQHCLEKYTAGAEDVLRRREVVMRVLDTEEQVMRHDNHKVWRWRTSYTLESRAAIKQGKSPEDAVH